MSNLGTQITQSLTDIPSGLAPLQDTLKCIALSNSIDDAQVLLRRTNSILHKNVWKTIMHYVL